jgi:hypothetical protein
VSGSPISLNHTRPPKTKVIVGEHAMKMDKKVTWNPICSKLDRIWWSSGVGGESIEIGCPNGKQK